MRNPAVRDLASGLSAFVRRDAFSVLPTNQMYRPLTTFSLAVDHALGGGLDPFYFHATNFLLFAAALVLLYVLGLLLGPPAGRRAGSFFGAALVAAHPATADTVNYVIQRGEIIAVVGVLASLCVRLSPGRDDAGGRAFHLVPFFVGCFGKQTAAIYPVLLFAALRGPRGLGTRRAFAASLPAGVLAVAYLVLQAVMASPTATGGGPGFAAYVATQPYVVLRYLGLAVVPSGLSVDPGVPFVWSARDPRFYLGTAGLALAAAAAARASRGRPVPRFGLVWAAATVLPTSLVPLAEAMNGHRTFFPFIGLALAAGGAAGPRLARLGGSRLAAAGVVAVLASLAHARCAAWRTPETLWSDVVAGSPENPRALMNLAAALMERGAWDDAGRLLREAERLAPGYGLVHTNLGVVAEALGRSDEAGGRFALGAALSADPVAREFLERWRRTRETTLKRCVLVARRVTPARPRAGRALRRSCRRP